MKCIKAFHCNVILLQMVSTIIIFALWYHGLVLFSDRYPVLRLPVGVRNFEYQEVFLSPESGPVRSGL